MAVALSHFSLGDENSPAIVLLHGMGRQVDHSSWDPVVPYFEKDYRAITVDLRGHGSSPAPGTYTMTEMADDVATLLNDLEVKDVILIGHSMGGIVALNLTLARPDLVSKLIIEDSPPPPKNANDAMFQPPIPENPVTYDLVQRPSILRELGTPNPGWAGRLDEIKVPVLVIGGGITGGMDQNGLQEIAQKLPKGEFFTINVGHNIHATNPAEFATAVQNWLLHTA